MKKLAAVFMMVFLLASCVPSYTETSAPDGVMTVAFIDVGQGDCSVIKLADGGIIMIDAGERTAVTAVTKYLDENKIDKIDYLVATHPHSDHIGAMADIIDNYDIGSVFMPKAQNDTSTFMRLLTSVKNKGLKIKAVKAGDFLFDDKEGVSAQFVAPNSDSYEDLNNYSAVLKLTYKDTSFLFTGDAEKLSEDEMLNQGYDLSSDVLKVGHHGSNTSTTAKFLKAVSPAYAVISCDGESYGHPSEKVVSRLEKAVGNRIYKTFEDGAVIMQSDGYNIVVKE